MAEQPPVNLIERVTDNPEVSEMKMDLQIEMPTATFEDAPEGIEIQTTEDGGVVVDMDPTASNDPNTGDFY